MASFLSKLRAYYTWPWNMLIENIFVSIIFLPGPPQTSTADYYLRLFSFFTGQALDFDSTAAVKSSSHVPTASNFACTVFFL